MRFLLFIGCFCWAIASLHAQQDTIMRKQLNVAFTDTPPKIDGLLDDEVWRSATVAGDFKQNRPDPGVVASEATEVRFLYDNDAVYISARMFERNADSINNFLTERDWFGNADWFIVVFNNYLDGVNGDGFAVTPAGVQIDIKYSSTGESNSWDAVWESATSIDEQGWVAEMKIPYSALRFPETEEQLWGINFGREIRRKRERSWWNFINPKIDGFLTQTGLLSGIKNISPPVRLSFFPYASAYIEHNSAADSYNYSFNGGMDVKYGLSDAFTLDMTLIPDFGQTRFDNQVLNLTPFEVQFNENRQFFTEGVELFNKADLFYSRRVGGTPFRFYQVADMIDSTESIEENPRESRLVNATKISGRNKKGLGIGIFNALENQTFATVKDQETGRSRRIETNPYTNYNVMVFDQVIRNNSSVTLTNTQVIRSGNTDDANVSKLNLQLADKKNRYAVRGFAAMSSLFQEDGDENGYSWNAAFAKISGNFRYDISQTVIGDRFNPNDLGFQRINNLSRTYLYTNYSIFKPFFIFNFMQHEFDITYERLYQPNRFFNFSTSWSSVYTLRNFHTFGLNAGVEPIKTNDFYETRTFQRFYKFPVNYWFGGFISSDYSRPFALDARFQSRVFDETGRQNFFYRIAPRFRPNDKLFFVIGYSRFQKDQEIGYITTQNDSITFGRRKVVEYENFINGSYIFNNRMALSLNLRHYWSTAVYNRFYLVEEDGALGDTDYEGFGEDGKSIHDISFNAFNIDLVYNWRFAPGSEISLVWKNIILSNGTPLDLNYFEDLEATISSPQVNNFSIKVLYFIDYLSFKKKDKPS